VRLHLCPAVFKALRQYFEMSDYPPIAVVKSDGRNAAVPLYVGGKAGDAVAVAPKIEAHKFGLHRHVLRQAEFARAFVTGLNQPTKHLPAPTRDRGSRTPGPHD
jgi:hypothetical protein